MWCRVIGVGARAAFGKTQDEELVLIPKCRHTSCIQIGDIVAFEKAPPFPSNRPHVLGEVKFFAQNPRIIARKLTAEERAVTRPRQEAVVWKQEHETAMDAQSYQERGNQ